MMLAVFVAMAEFERDLIREPSSVGMQAAQNAGIAMVATLGR